jgi:tRNA nucleotidyltransferase (CCA-adding enzyme)
LTLEEDVLREIKPDDEQTRALANAVSALEETVRETIARLKFEARPVLVGSVAKGTNLKDPDIDMFIVFPESTPRNSLQASGLKIGESVLENPTKQFAEHPYTRGIFQGFRTEIVPCYAVPEAHTRMSAVDRTPFHTRFVKKKLTDEQKDDVRLLKAFTKGIGVYGAEIATRGFSGYLCEILVIKYGGFKRVLEATKRWSRRKTVIEIDGHPGTKRFDDPMTFIDPVDSNRNVAAPVSDHSYSIFIHAAAAYLRKPDIRFFFPEPVRILPTNEIVARFGERGTSVLGIETGIPDVVEDTYHSQLIKALGAFEKTCWDGGYPVLHSGYFVNGRVLFILELEVHELSPVTRHTGPEIGHPNEEDFLIKWRDHERRVSGPSILDRRWVVHIKREYTRASELLADKIPELNLGKNMNEEFRKGYKFLPVEDIAENYREWVSAFLEDRFPWER